MVAVHWGWIVFASLAFLFLVTAIIIGCVLLWRLRWKMKWVLLQEQPNGKLEIVKRGSMRPMAFGDGGEEIFYLRGVNKFKVAYGKRIGKNQVAWAVGQDGYWYNVDFGGIDKRLREAGVFPVDRDMRMANSVARKGIEQKHGSKDFMEKYGTIIAFGMLFLCICALGLSQWWAFHELNKGKAQSTEQLSIQKEVVDRYDALLSRIQGSSNTNSDSGIRSVTPASGT